MKKKSLFKESLTFDSTPPSVDIPINTIVVMPTFLIILSKSVPKKILIVFGYDNSSYPLLIAIERFLFSEGGIDLCKFSKILVIV